MIKICPPMRTQSTSQDDCLILSGSRAAHKDKLLNPNLPDKGGCRDEVAVMSSLLRTRLFLSVLGTYISVASTGKPSAHPA
ncbi:hypothetical protein MUK42_36189 [Musa troglodytarum]|uniref:Uncharacterized protein n=1 Tax=Musa troglodytarum TaxID=320322 RepID=A0A9E7FAA1_9LILI|nr:hypothetical protein MUK42_36189 [Musa troglodytarum]URD92289.1 hypothetical protein MUK42_36189 [Musa troglodytarum]